MGNAIDDRGGMTSAATPQDVTGSSSPLIDIGDAARLGLAKEATDVRERSKAVSDKLRDRADAWGKGLTTLGTAAVGYLGLTRATDVYPIPPGWGWLSALAIACLVLMAAIAVSIGWRLSRVGRAILMKNNPSAIPDLNDAERDDVAELYNAYAKLNGKGSLEAYDNEGQKIAAAYEKQGGGKPAPAEPYTRAVQIRAEVQCAQQRAATLIVRGRVTKATTGFLTMASVGACIIFGAVFGIATDKIADLRASPTEVLTTIKQCGEASAAKAIYPAITTELPAACSS